MFNPYHNLHISSMLKYLLLLYSYFTLCLPYLKIYLSKQ